VSTANKELSRRLATHIAEGIRATLPLASAEAAGGGDAPGLAGRPLGLCCTRHGYRWPEGRPWR